jgi:hypothetical protein
LNLLKKYQISDRECKLLILQFHIILDVDAKLSKLANKFDRLPLLG